VGKTLTPRTWPGKARVAVCLSFDVDNESYLLAAGETSPNVLSTGDFGVQTGLPRVLRLLDKHQVPATFFIPAVSAILHPEMVPAILKNGKHEIGVHEWVHEYLPALENAAEEARLLDQAIDYLYSFLAHMEAVSAMMATPKSMPEATRPRISEPCKPAASIRGLPKLFSKTIVPINAKPRPANTLPFFIQAPSARILAQGYYDRNGAAVSRRDGISGAVQSSHPLHDLF